MNAEKISPITTYFRVCDGVRVRFADTKSDSDATLLLLAPWPESVWAFRRIWRHVAELGRVVAIDLPGFGHSDQSRPELIAPDTAGAFLERLIDDWGLGAPHIVGPDVGTAAALFLAAKIARRVSRKAAESPRCRRAVIMRGSVEPYCSDRRTGPTA